MMRLINITPPVLYLYFHSKITVRLESRTRNVCLQLQILNLDLILNKTLSTRRLKYVDTILDNL